MCEDLVGESSLILWFKKGRLQEVVGSLLSVTQPECSDSTVGPYSVSLPMIEVLTVLFFKPLEMRLRVLESAAVNVCHSLLNISVDQAFRIVQLCLCGHPHNLRELRQQLVIHVRLNVLYLHHDDCLEELLVNRKVAADTPAERDSVLSLEPELAFQANKELLTDRLPAEILQRFVGGSHLLKRAQHVSIVELVRPLRNQPICRFSESPGSPEFVQQGRIGQKGFNLIVKQEPNEFLEKIRLSYFFEKVLALDDASQRTILMNKYVTPFVCRRLD